MCILHVLTGYEGDHLHRKGARCSIVLLKVVLFAGKIIRVALTDKGNKTLCVYCCTCKDEELTNHLL